MVDKSFVRIMELQLRRLETKKILQQRISFIYFLFVGFFVFMQNHFVRITADSSFSSRPTFLILLLINITK